MRSFCLKMGKPGEPEVFQNRIIFLSKSVVKWPLVLDKHSQWELWVWNLKFPIYIWWLKIENGKHKFSRALYVWMSTGEQLMRIPQNFSRHLVKTTLFRQKRSWAKNYLFLNWYILFSPGSPSCDCLTREKWIVIVSIHKKINGLVDLLL